MGTTVKDGAIRCSQCLRLRTLDEDGLCSECQDGPITHYHIVSFINGCLNDYDDGPYETLQVARAALDAFLDANDDTFPWQPAGVDRYEQQGGPYILKIEECTEADCLIDN